LESYVTKSDLQKICQNLGLQGTGNKGDLVARVLGDSRLTCETALYYVNRDNMKKLCEDLKLPATGTRREMESRVANLMARLPKAARATPSYEPSRYTSPIVQTPTVATYAPPPQQVPITPPPMSPVPPPGAEVPSGQDAVKAPLTEPTQESAPPSPPPYTVPEPPSLPSIPARPELQSVFEFIENWRPTKPYRDESKYQIELAMKLSSRFGDECVKTELNVLDGRIDIEVMCVGVELKVPSKTQLQRLVGQANMYRKHYGPNLIVVIFAEKARMQDIIAFRNDLAALGVKVCVK
jgi:hypothetical protein